jgi:hypothetical protein
MNKLYLIFILCLGLIILAGCGSKNTSGSGGATNSSNIVEVSSISRCLSVYNNVTNEPNDTCINMGSIYTGFKYQLNISFTLTTKSNFNSIASLKLILELGRVDVTQSQINESDSGSVSDLDFKDQLGNTMKKSEITVFVPRLSGQIKTVSISVDVIPISVAQDLFKMYFEPDNEAYMLDGNGNDGFTRSITILPSQLNAPSIELDYQTKRISWNHIEHAKKYRIFIDDVYKTEVLYDSEFIPVGSKLYYVLPENGVYTIKIQALSNTTLFTPSVFSNTININD